MVEKEAEVVICGAGIAGIASAYHLAVLQGVRNVLLVDERPPLTLTSDKSTEAYRNFWPGPDGAMVELMNRSIRWLEELVGQTGNLFNLNRRGYIYCTAESSRVPDWENAAGAAVKFGAGPLRVHDHGGRSYFPNIASQGRSNKGLDGADLITSHALIRKHFPYLSEETAAVLHIRKAGWLSAQQLGSYLLSRAKAAGTRVIQNRVSGVEQRGGRIDKVLLSDGRAIQTRNFVNAAGPFVREVGEMIGVEIPIFCERHLKVSLQDRLGALPRAMPLAVWTDPQKLPWTKREAMELRDDPETQWLLEPFPGGVHTRPEGEGNSQVVLILWDYDAPVMEPVFPIPLDEFFPEIALRGLATMIPALKPYFHHLPKPFVDGGYYTKTKENRPLACPLPVDGAYMIGGLSGFGIMGALALGELLAAHITGGDLPGYATSFDLNRYDDPSYQAQLNRWGASWQL